MGWKLAPPRAVWAAATASGGVAAVHRVSLRLGVVFPASSAAQLTSGRLGYTLRQCFAHGVEQQNETDGQDDMP